MTRVGEKAEQMVSMKVDKTAMQMDDKTADSMACLSVAQTDNSKVREKAHS